ncbi:hypothetical protein CIHG_06762 [Coccidioides immitis H538.4]|uniref:Secreted protein n=2 Tax=Coccidioides immitis TaxID=5501 RepID=A0A0J8RWJ5_COCIT|nr:hypothetical protein CIRG_01660 [Coccidioides immitis RMSCC 2394]KMU88961.1 hypothetical protein CIHG_06762 [Coccidioides immitis H538.4]
MAWQRHKAQKAQISFANFLFLLSTSRFGCAQHPNSNGNMPGMGSRAVRLMYGPKTNHTEVTSVLTKAKMSFQLPFASVRCKPFPTRQRNLPYDEWHWAPTVSYKRAGS